MNWISSQIDSLQVAFAEIGRFRESVKEFIDEPTGPEAMGKLVEAANKYRRSMRNYRESRVRLGYS